MGYSMGCLPPGAASVTRANTGHQRVVKNMSDERGERLSAVNVRKAVVAGKGQRREPQRGEQSGRILVMEASRLM